MQGKSEGPSATWPISHPRWQRRVGASQLGCPAGSGALKHHNKTITRLAVDSYMSSLRRDVDFLQDTGHQPTATCLQPAGNQWTLRILQACGYTYCPRVQYKTRACYKTRPLKT